jgi:hypothetical protein
MVTLLLWRPMRPEESNFTSMVPLSPGGTGALLKRGTVQPQLALASTMISDPSP